MLLMLIGNGDVEFRQENGNKSKLLLIIILLLFYYCYSLLYFINVFITQLYSIHYTQQNRSCLYLSHNRDISSNTAVKWTVEYR